MDELQQKVADLQAKKEALEADPNGIDTNAYNLIVNQLSEAQDELSQQQEKVQRDQQQQTVIDNAVDLLPTIFEALFPADTFQQILGLNNYTDKQTQFYQIVKAYTAEQVQTASQTYESTIAQKDDKIKALNTQSLNVQQQLDAANKALQDEKDAHDKTSAELADTKTQLTAAQADSASKDETITELQNKLNAAQQPKADPSANLQDMITQTKSKSALSADDMVARWNARQTQDSAKVQVPEVPSTAPATFPDSSATSQTDHNGDTTASSAEVQPPSLDTFQQTSNPATGNDTASTAASNGSNVADGQQGVQQAGAVTREEFDALTQRVAALEQGKAQNAA